MPSISPTLASSSRPIDALGVAGATLCCGLWGANAVAVKYSVPAIPAFGCAGLRFLLALPVVAIVCRTTGSKLWAGWDRWQLVLVHALFSFVQIGTFNLGTSLSLAGRASVFINVHPLVVAPLSWIILGERMGTRGLGGLGAATIGVIVLLSSGFDSAGSITGDLIVIASGMIFGAQTITQKWTFPKIAPATLLFSQYIFAIPMFFIFTLSVEGLPTEPIPLEAILGLLFQGLAVSGVCFSTWFLMLKRYPANRLATLAFMTPLFGVGLGTLIRGEAMRWELAVSGLLVGIGIYLVASDRVTHRSPSMIELPGEDAL